MRLEFAMSAVSLKPDIASALAALATWGERNFLTFLWRGQRPIQRVSDQSPRPLIDAPTIYCPILVIHFSKSDFQVVACSPAVVTPFFARPWVTEGASAR